MTQVLVSEREIEQAQTVPLRDNSRFALVTDGESHDLPAELSAILRDVVRSLSEGGAVSVRTLPLELTTSMAAQILDISRPTLMKLIQRQEIPAHKVGTHFRVKTADVLDFQERRIQRQVEALERLRHWDAED